MQKLLCGVGLDIELTPQSWHDTWLIISDKLTKVRLSLRLDRSHGAEVLLRHANAEIERIPAERLMIADTR
jgi:hypothetical protein